MPESKGCQLGSITGPWAGPSSWVYKVFCLRCGWEEITEVGVGGYDTCRAILQARRESTPVCPGRKVKPTKKVSKALAKKRVAAKRRQQQHEEEWEVFF